MEQSNNKNVTLFCEVYCKFLSKITDEMYLELTYQDTLQILKSMLLSAIVNFKFPKNNIRNYYLAPLNNTNCDSEAFEFFNEKTMQNDFIEYCDCSSILHCTEDLNSLDHWLTKLSIDEIEILSLSMKLDWLSQQLDNTNILRMKIVSSNFELPSQANHIAKLTEWYKECEIQLNKLQDLYNRRIINEEGNVSPNYKVLGGKKHVRKKQVRL